MKLPCSKCGQLGHWHEDDDCPKKKEPFDSKRKHHYDMKNALKLGRQMINEDNKDNDEDAEGEGEGEGEQENCLNIY